MVILQFNFFVVTVKYLCNGRRRITTTYFLVLVLPQLRLVFAMQLQCFVFILNVLQSKFTKKMLGKMSDFYISRYQLFRTSFKIFFKKIFVANFLHSNLHPLNCHGIPISAKHDAKLFCWCSLNEQSSGIDGIATSPQSSQNFKQNVTF